jgi:hypothetical protein
MKRLSTVLITEAQDTMYTLLTDLLDRHECSLGTALGILQDGLAEAVRRVQHERPAK